MELVDLAADGFAQRLEAHPGFVGLQAALVQLIGAALRVGARFVLALALTQELGLRGLQLAHGPEDVVKSVGEPTQHQVDLLQSVMCVGQPQVARVARQRFIGGLKVSICLMQFDLGLLEAGSGGEEGAGARRRFGMGGPQALVRRSALPLGNRQALPFSVLGEPRPQSLLLPRQLGKPPFDRFEPSRAGGGAGRMSDIDRRGLLPGAGERTDPKAPIGRQP